MIKETPPSNIYEIGKEFDFMRLENIEYFLKAVEQTNEIYSGAESPDDTLQKSYDDMISNIEKIAREIDMMKELCHENPDAGFIDSVGDIIYLHEWQINLDKARAILNKKTKKRKKSITRSKDDMKSKTEQVSESEMAPETTISENAVEVEALESADENTVNEATERTEKKIVTKKGGKTNKVESGKNTGDNPLDALNSLEGLDSGYLSPYDKLVKDFIDVGENKNQFLKERRGMLAVLIEEAKSKDEDKRKTFIEEHVKSIGALIAKIESVGFKNGGEEQMINLLKLDVERLKKLDINFGDKKIETEKINKSPEKKEGREVDALRSEIINFKEIKTDILSYRDRLKKGEDDKLGEEVKNFIEQNRVRLESYLTYIKHSGKRVAGGGDLSEYINYELSLLTRLENLLNGKAEPEDTEEEEPVLSTKEKKVKSGSDKGSKEYLKDFEKIDILKNLDPKEIFILQTNGELANALLVATETYNRLLEKEASKEELIKADVVVGRLREEWLKYKKWFLEEREFDLPKSKKDKKKEKEGSTTPETTITPDTYEAPRASDTTVGVEAEVIEDGMDLPLEKLFTLEIGKNYSHITENKDFNSWLVNIYNSLKIEGKNNIFEQKDIEAWYKKYEEVLPYYKKLKEIYEDSASLNDSLKQMMSRTKMNSFIYELYKGDKSYEAKIDEIYNLYSSIKEKRKVIEEKKKMDALKTELIANKKGELKPDQVKNIFESLGEEGVSENIEELEKFLVSMDDNYDFYSSGASKEEEGDSTKNTIAKFIKFREKGEKIHWTKKWWSKIDPSRLWTKESIEDTNTYAPMIEALQKQNLVNRKDKDEAKTRENKLRMRRLLDLMRDKKDDLIKYSQKPESVDTSSWDDEDKKSLSVFATMYKTFTQQKYKTSAAKQKAESMLSETDDSYLAEEAGLVKESESMFIFDTKEDMERLEKRAVYESSLTNLDTIEREINNFPKNGRNVDLAKNLSTIFTGVEAVFSTDSEYVNENDRLRLKKINIKLSELILRHVNKNNFAEVYSSLKNYDAILESKEMTKEDKETYFKDLIKSLELHLKNPANTIFQKTMLNAMIKEYTIKLNSIK